MFGRGENVGTAYVRIVAEGSGLDKSIRDEFKKAEPTMEQAGERHSENYQKGFEEGLHRRTRENREHMIENLGLGRGEMDGRAKTIGSDFAKELRNNLRKSLSEGDGDHLLADTIWNRLMGDFRRTGNKEIFGSVLQNLPRLVEDATREIQAAENRQEQDSNRHLTKWFQQQRSTLKAFNAAQLKDRLDADRMLENHWQKLADDFASLWDEAHLEDKHREERAYKDRLDRDRMLESHWQRLADDWGAIWDEAHLEDARRTAQNLKMRLDADKDWDLHLAEEERKARHYYDMLQAYREHDLRNQRHLAMVTRAYNENERRDISKLMQSYKDLTALADRMSKGTEETKHNRAARLAELLALRPQMEKFGLVTHKVNDALGDAEREFRRFRPTSSFMGKWAKDIDKMAEATGKAFGEGSRNNFVNFIAKFGKGMVSLIGLPFRAGDAIFQYGQKLKNALDEGKLIPTLLGDVGKLVSGAGVAFTGLFGVIGPLVSILSLAAGVVAALASTIGFALVGAIGVLAGALAPGILAVGTLTLAFAGMNTAQKKILATKMKPVIDEFHQLRQAARDGLFGKDFANVGKMAKETAPAIRNLQPLFRNMGAAVADIGTSWAKSMNEKGFKDWLGVMEKFMPNAARRLGRITGDVFAGIGGLLRALIPSTQTFLKWLEGVTEHFEHWSNSVRGQNYLTTFFDHATQSAANLGGFLMSVTDLLGTIMSGGRTAGDSLFGSMTAAINSWNKSLKKNPDILQKWFQDSVKFGRAVGDAFVGLGKVFGALDSQGSRTLAITAFRSLATILHTVADILAPLADLFDSLGPVVVTVGTNVAAAAVVFGKLHGALAGLGTGLSGTISGLKAAETRMGALKGMATSLAGAGGIALLSYSLSKVNNHASGTTKTFGVLGSALGGAAAGLAFGPWGAAIGGVAGASLGLWKALHKTSDTMKSTKQDNVNYAATLDTITGAATKATRALVLQQLQRKGILAQSAQFGISSRDLIGAVLGEKDAIGRVNKEALKSPDLLKRLTAQNILSRLGLLRRNFETQADAIKNANAATTSWKEALAGIKDKRLRIAIKNVGMEPTIKQIDKLNQKFHLTPKEVRTIVKATNMDLTTKEVNALIRRLQDADKQHPKPKVDVQDNTKKPVQDIVSRLTALNRSKNNPKVGVDDNTASPVSTIRERLRILAGAFVKPHVGIDSNPALDAIRLIQARINALYGKTIVVRTEHMDTRIGVPRTAVGGLFNGAQLRWIGEAGPEAVVPLDRPLSQVDPAVRWLSAIAQGKDAPKMATGGVVGRPSIDASGWQIVSPNSDPRAVASEVLNQLAAAAY